MNMAFLFYLNLLLLVRFFFYFGERPRDILAYTLKAAIEIALLLVIFRMSIFLSLSSAALLLILNLLQFILESKLPQSIANEQVSGVFTRRPFSPVWLYMRLQSTLYFMPTIR